MTHINYDHLLAALTDTPLADWTKKLPEQIANGLSEKRFGDLAGWKASLAKLPTVSTKHIELGA